MLFGSELKINSGAEKCLDTSENFFEDSLYHKINCGSTLINAKLILLHSASLRGDC